MDKERERERERERRRKVGERELEIQKCLYRNEHIFYKYLLIGVS
jgi:hypothetical protein